MAARRQRQRQDFATDPGLVKHGNDETYQMGCRCQECRRNRQQRNLEYYYSMSVEQYEELLSYQDGRCAICRELPRGTKRGKLNVDHCHETGAVRGLLCSTCNTGIGKLGDSIEGLERALAYLKESEAKSHAILEE
jgi:hypothetical protein